MSWGENRKKSSINIKLGLNTKTSKTVIGVRLSTGERKEFHSTQEAFRQTGISSSNISQCCLNKRKTAGKHYWYYK